MMLRAEVICEQNSRIEGTSAICEVMFAVSEMGGTDSVMCNIAETDDWSIDVDD